MNQIKEIKEEGRRGVITNVNKYANEHPTSEEIDAT